MLFEYLSTIATNQEKMMATLDELRAAHTNLAAKVAELNSTTAAKLTAVAADVTYLRDQIAAGAVSQEDVAKANAAVAGIQSVISALSAFDAVPEFPATPPEQ